ncbi:hypothetical protein PIIN_05343, partial [Serendipita indica DSM 11827]
MPRLFMFVSLWPSCDSRMLNPTTTTKERIRRILVLLKLRRKKEKPAIFTAHLSPESTHAEPDRNSEHEHTRTRSTAQHIYEEPNGDPEAGSEETPSESIHSACTQISDSPSVSPAAHRNLERLLPDELLLTILEIFTEYCGYIGMDIDPEVLYGQTPNLRRPPVAGRWYRIGIHLLWSHLIIQRGLRACDKTSPLIPWHIVGTLLENPRYLHHVSHITFLNAGNDNPIYDRHDEWTMEVLNRLPNLRRLRCSSSLLCRLGDKAFPASKINRIRTWFSEDVTMPYIPQKESISCLEILLYSSTQLQFPQVQEFPQLTTLYINQERDPWRSAYFGPFIIAPKLKTLCIQLPNQAWSIDYGLPRESFRTLCVLEVVGTDRKGGPPNSVTSVRTLPL